MKKKTRKKLELVLHTLTALLLLIKGLDQLHKELYFPGGIITGISIIILIIAHFWRLLKIPPKQSRIICYYIESPGLLLVSYVLYLEGKAFLPEIFLLTGIMYPVLGFISSKKFKRIRKSSV